VAEISPLKKSPSSPAVSFASGVIASRHLGASRYLFITRAWAAHVYLLLVSARTAAQSTHASFARM